MLRKSIPSALSPPLVKQRVGIGQLDRIPALKVLQSHVLVYDARSLLRAREVAHPDDSDAARPELFAGAANQLAQPPSGELGLAPPKRGQKTFRVLLVALVVLPVADEDNVSRDAILTNVPLSLPRLCDTTVFALNWRRLATVPVWVPKRILKMRPPKLPCGK